MLAALDNLERRPRVKLLVLAVLALLISAIPVLSSVFNWFETFFHELSHGIVALITGASIVSIELNWDGSGLIRYAGSWSPALVNFFGYPGAVLCGIALYLVAISQPRYARNLALGMGTLIAVTALLWMRDLTSWIIAIAMAAILAGLWRYAGNILARLALELIAVYLMIAGIHAIWSMLGFQGRGDAQSLAQMTWLPAFIFPLIWMAIGLGALWWLWRREERRSR